MLSLNIGLVWTIINLIIFYLLLRRFLFGPVMAIMEKRRQMIAEQLDHAKQTEEQANERKSQYEAALASAKDESGQIVEQAKKDAKTEYERIVGHANDEAVRIIKDARATVRAERSQAMKEMESQIAGLALTAAEKLLAEKAGKTDGTAVYDRFLEETGDAYDTDGN